MASSIKHHKALAFLAISLTGLIMLALGFVLFVYIPNSESEIFSFVDHAAPQIGVAVDRNGSVADVLPGSPAEKAGIARGDVFKQVGNTVITSNDSLQGVIRQEIVAKITPIIEPHVSGNFNVTDLPLVVRRGGQDLNIVVRPTSPPFVRPSGNQSFPTATAVPASSDWIYV